jgi:hypothetical protein
MYTNSIKINLNTILNPENSDKYNVKKYTFNNIVYNIAKYNKPVLKSLETSNIDEFNELAKCRSIILKNNKVVAFSPPKSIGFDLFKNTHSNISESWAEDFIDGTMINVFFDNLNQIWEIATRSTVGGNIIFFNDVKNYKYFNKNKTNIETNMETNIETETQPNPKTTNDNNYHNATFRTLFFEACNANNFNLNTLDRRFCYSFVLQHPVNRIVTPTSMPMIYLIKVYEIVHNVDLNTNVTINELNLQNFISTPPFIFLNTNVKFVNKYPITNYTDVETYYNSENIPYYCVGCMIYNVDGSRSKIRNNNYEKVRKMRGNNPKLQYNYLCLKQENKVKEFLQYYPEHNVIFNKFKNLVYDYTNGLFINYISCFIRKEKPLKEYEFQYKNHMYKLHEKFKSELKPNNKTIDKKFIIDYVNSLHPAQQMFIMNYNNYSHDNYKQTVKNETTEVTTNEHDNNEVVMVE